MLWTAIELREWILPPGPGIVLGISLGDRWPDVRARQEGWFAIDDRDRSLKLLQTDGEICFQAEDERDTPGDDIYGFQLDVLGRGPNRDVVERFTTDLRASFRDRLGLHGEDEMYTVYKLPPHGYDERLLLFTRAWSSENAASIRVWTDI